MKTGPAAIHAPRNPYNSTTATGRELPEMDMLRNGRAETENNDRAFAQFNTVFDRQQ